MLTIIIIIGKLVSVISRYLNLGSGATWPGEIALRLNPQILKPLALRLKKGIILVAGTNGKTTTSLMLKQILEYEGQTVVHNGSGANLLNGVVSAFFEKASWLGDLKADWGVFEVDENSLPLVITNLPINQFTNKKKTLIIVLLNLFRDQLDRYGEVDVIAEKWEKALRLADARSGPANRRTSWLASGLTIVANADDPLIAHIAKKSKQAVVYFGLNEPAMFLKKMEHATDSIFCLNCGGRLSYTGLYYSHLGIWHCEKCGERRPSPDLSQWQSPLPGLYNLYNTLAAVSAARQLGVSDKNIDASLSSFAPAFGRQEELKYDSKKVKIFLSKNPAGFNASLRTVLELKPKTLLLVLNDRIPDGRDVSWIWDVDFEMIPEEVKVIVSGERVYDLALRIKYAQKSQISNPPAGRAGLKSQIFVVEPNLNKSIKVALEQLKEKETLYILPTYSAMLEVRKLLSGRKIL